MRSLLRHIVLPVCVLIFNMSPAGAGAFLQQEGDFLLISTSRFTGSVRTVDAQGRLIPVDYFAKHELSAYLEYGAAEWLTLILQPTGTRAYKEGPPEGGYFGLGSIEAGARVKIARYEDVVFSAQAVAHVAGSHNRDNPALIGNTGNEFDFRVLAGMPFAIADFPGFVDVQLGYRFRRDGPPNEFRLDMTLGVRPFERLLLMLQSFNIVAPAAGAAGYPAMRQHKLQASAVLDFGKAYSVQAGAFTTVAARNARHEYGLISGVWYRF